MTFKITAEEKAWILRQRKKAQGTDYALIQQIKEDIGKTASKLSYKDATGVGTNTVPNAVYLYSNVSDNDPGEDVALIVENVLGISRRILKFKSSIREYSAKFTAKGLPFFVTANRNVGVNNIVFYVNFNG